ncbi:MAG: DUF4173 domain-containing protein [Oscillospiraceae bacterium]|nr:DUF4173 domain-containing protein [Oscillospiraceae bacterium]
MENRQMVTQGDESLLRTQWPEQSAEEKVGNAFKPDLTDFLFAIAAFALGYLFSRWVFFSWRGWGVAAFTTAYLLGVTAYLMKKGAFVKSGAAVYWAAVTWLTGASYALWGNAGFAGVRGLFLFCSATYYVLVASGTTLMGRTGNYLLIDGIKAVIIVPFRNILNQYVSFSALGKGARRGRVLPVILGTAVALMLALIIIPLLESADAGGFGVLMGFVRSVFRFSFVEIAIYVFFAIPVAAYLYGLVSGAAHRKGTDIIKPESAASAVAALRIVQPATINIVLGSVCALYLVFIFSQLPYFFSAFTGSKPDGWLTYSEFARRGFFELCGIAAINLTLLTISNLCSKKVRAESQILKIFNIALAILTLVLIATAFSKMALYIGVFGLTMRRLLPCIFMVFMAAVFVALIALQKWDFSIVRFSLVVGSAMIVALCLSNPDAMVVRYNTGRYLSGTLREYDMEIVRRSGVAGVLPAIEVYNSTSNEQLRGDLRRHLSMHSSIGGNSSPTLSFESHRAWRAVIEGGFIPQAPTPQR